MSGYFKCAKCLQLFTPAIPTDAFCQTCASGYKAGQRVMARTDRWGWVAAKIQWCSGTHAATITEGDQPYLLTVSLTDVKPHASQEEKP